MNSPTAIEDDLVSRIVAKLPDPYGNAQVQADTPGKEDIAVTKFPAVIISRGIGRNAGLKLNMGPRVGYEFSTYWNVACYVSSGKTDKDMRRALDLLVAAVRGIVFMYTPPSQVDNSSKFTLEDFSDPTLFNGNKGSGLKLVDTYSLRELMQASVT